MALGLLPSDSYGGMMDITYSSSVSLSKAAQACISCRKQKRKCDKTLPMCSLCARMGRQCDYTDTPAAPTADDLAVLQARLADLENRLSAANANANANSHSQSPGSGSGSSLAVTNSSTNTMETSPPPLRSSETDHSQTTSIISRIGTLGSLYTAPQKASHFPAALFLDSDCFKWAGLHIPRPNVDIPPKVLAILSNSPTTIQETTTSYFEQIHPWFPIISRKRMSIGSSLLEGGPDIAMLFLAMKLSTFQPHGTGISPAQDELYISAKKFLSLLEVSGCISLAHLQAQILVTLYEIGHAIYPSAWMSVSSCARYIEITGLPSFKESSTFLGAITTWTEMEERRRCWWAVYILDRIICLGNKKRCVMPEPDENFLLPVDDDAWDSGDPARSLQHGVRTGLDIPQGPFARLVQGAVLVSSILTHCRKRIGMFRMGKTDSDPEQSIAQVHSLLETIQTYTEITSQELGLAAAQSSNNNRSRSSGSQSQRSGAGYSYFARLTPRCIATSAQILLYDAYACPENLCDGPSPIGSDSFPPKSTAQLQMQVTAVTGLRTSSLAMRELSLEILENVMLPSEQVKISPLCLDALYCAVASLHWLYKEGGEEEIGTALGDVRNCMGRLGMRWDLGRVYGEVMGFHDVVLGGR